MEKKMMHHGSCIFWGVGLGVILAMVASCRVHAITCPDVVDTLKPCVPYLTVKSPDPSGPCCTAMTELSEKAPTITDRRDICKCMQFAASGFGFAVDRARALPRLCAVGGLVPTDPTVNCNSIPM